MAPALDLPKLNRALLPLLTYPVSWHSPPGRHACSLLQPCLPSRILVDPIVVGVTALTLSLLPSPLFATCGTAGTRSEEQANRRTGDQPAVMQEPRRGMTLPTPANQRPHSPPARASAWTRRDHLVRYGHVCSSWPFPISRDSQFWLGPRTTAALR